VGAGGCRRGSGSGDNGWCDNGGALDVLVVVIAMEGVMVSVAVMVVLVVLEVCARGSPCERKEHSWAAEDSVSVK
jgi:hypothetical protein